jgi:hypothetical protein
VIIGRRDQPENSFRRRRGFADSHDRSDMGDLLKAMMFRNFPMVKISCRARC